jgi:hypothetical protein
MVLRSFTRSEAEGPVVQMLDTNAHAGGDSVMFGKHQGIFAGGAFSTVPGTQANFVGLGTLPPLTAEAEKQFDTLRRARPVGLARLVVAQLPERAGAELGEENILFISRMIPMWSREEPTRNYSIARLLLSLRNTPYHASLRAFWIVYAPRGVFAEVMWEAGARDKSLEELQTETVARANEYAPGKPELDEHERENSKKQRSRLSTALDLMPMVVLSHNEKGLAQQIWRLHLAPVGQGTPPKIIRELFIATGSPSIAYLMKKQKELEKLIADDRNRRAKRALELNKAITNAAGRGDKAAVASLKAERDAMYAAPLEGLSDLHEMARDPFADKFVSPLTPYREDPSAWFTHESLAQPASFELPELLR